MGTRKRPTINATCVADKASAPRERIAEVSFADGKGCLISCRTLADGAHVIEVYRCDEGITVVAPTPKKRVRKSAVRRSQDDLIAAEIRRLDPWKR